MPGPAPKHPSVRARRNNPKSDFTSLPAQGREGDAPVWPLLPDVEMVSERDLALSRIKTLEAEIADAEDGRTKGRLRRQLSQNESAAAKLSLQIEQAEAAERALWAELWSTPQAVMWEQSYAHREVAQYVRWKVRAEQGDIKAAGEARQWSDRLGLNPLAMLRLRIEVARADEVEDRGQRRRASAPKKTVRKDPPDDPRSILSVVS